MESTAQYPTLLPQTYQHSASWNKLASLHLYPGLQSLYHCTRHVINTLVVWSATHSRNGGNLKTQEHFNYTTAQVRLIVLISLKFGAWILLGFLSCLLLSRKNVTNPWPRWNEYSSHDLKRVLWLLEYLTPNTFIEKTGRLYMYLRKIAMQCKWPFSSLNLSLLNYNLSMY